MNDDFYKIRILALENIDLINKWSKKNKQLQRAEPGEAALPTRLYSPMFTPHKQLGE